ncbi:MAG: hypothetical protein U1E47_02935 [Rivihabitans pingtungensis]
MTLNDAPGKEIVLVVDDFPENLALLYDALDEAGYTVLVTPTANPPSAAPACRCPT